MVTAKRKTWWRGACKDDMRAGSKGDVGADVSESEAAERDSVMT